MDEPLRGEPGEGSPGRGALSPGSVGRAGDESARSEPRRTGVALWCEAAPSIPAGPHLARPSPRLPLQSLFEHGCRVRPYLYFNAASKPGAVTSQGEREGARSRTVRWRGNWGRREKGSPQPPPAGREPFWGGHGLPSRTALPLHPSRPPTVNSLLAHIHQPWEPPCHPVGTVASSLCCAENQSPWNEHWKRGGRGGAAPDVWPQTHLNLQRGARGSAGASPVGACT